MLPRRDPAASLVGDLLNSLGDALEYLRQARPALPALLALPALPALLTLHMHMHMHTRQAFVDLFTEAITVNLVLFAMASIGMGLLALYRLGGRLRRQLRRRKPYLDSGAAGGTCGPAGEDFGVGGLGESRGRNAAQRLAPPAPRPPICPPPCSPSACDLPLPTLPFNLPLRAPRRRRGVAHSAQLRHGRRGAEA